MIDLPGPETHIYTPSELNQEAKRHIEAGFGRVWIQGEISNLARPASGHLYFSLKDGQAQIRCALFKPQATKLSFEPANGDEVLVRGQLSLYAPRGDYQLIASDVLGAGLGALHAAFEALKAKLSAEGLFDPELKKPLPKWPQRIALVTSSSGAALRDIRQTLAKRWPIATTELYPSLVQGDQAPASLIKALLKADKVPDNDVIILARGGGSIEDLWAFNDESLARTVAALRLPVISGVGHETDTTIVDFVADLRAATPTAAAVLATPDEAELSQTLKGLAQTIERSMLRLLNQHGQSLDIMEQRLLRLHPIATLEKSGERLGELKRRLSLAAQHRLTHQTDRLSSLARTLNSLSPLAVLERGYAIVQDANGHSLNVKNPPIKGSIINVLLEEIEVISSVESVRPRAPQSD